MVTAATGASRTRSSKKVSSPDFEAQAKEINTILSDETTKVIILDLKDFGPLRAVASFSLADLATFAKEHPLLARTIIGAYGKKS